MNLNKNNLSVIFKYLLYALVVLPVFIFRDFTPDNELRYLSIADEALRNGSVFTFTNHGIIYADKPPLYMWIVMLGKLVLGNHNMLFLGIFSFLPALIVLHVMDQWVKDLLPESERLLAQLMLITSGYFIGAALVLRMDMLMCMFIILSLYTFFRIYRGESKKYDTLLFPVYVFLAIFSKGPVGIIIPLISTVVFLYTKGEIKKLGRYWGWKTWTVLFFLCAIWFTGVYAEGGSKYLDDLLFNQTVNRAVNAFHHKEPFYYYFTTIWYSLAPWSLLYAGILLVGLKKKLATTDLERFFLIVTLSTFMILSLISAKLDIYMLPAFPFIAYLTMLWLTKLNFQKWMRILIGIPACIFCLALPGAIMARMLTEDISYLTAGIIFFAAFVLSLSGIFTIIELKNNKIHQSIRTISIGLLMAIFVVSFAIPSENSFIGMRNLCLEAKKESIHKNIENYYCFNISRAENLDVYLSKEPKNLSEKDLLNANSIIQKPAILFVSKEDIIQNNTLQKLVLKENHCKVGNYYYVIIE